MACDPRDVILTELSMLDEMFDRMSPEQVIERESVKARRRKVLAELEALTRGDHERRGS
ncbi:MAG: hypothetical protein R3B89_06560 [Polyangiaceae bacterium]